MSFYGGWWDPVLEFDPFESMRRMMEESGGFWEQPEWAPSRIAGGRRGALEGPEGARGSSQALTAPSGATAQGVPPRHRRIPIRMDMIEAPDSLTIIAEMPGFRKEDIRIHCDEHNMLEIEAERREERAAQPGESVPRRELSYGFWRRAVRLPPYADPKNAQSEYKNGMLGIKFGRRPVPGVQQIAVQ